MTPHSTKETVLAYMAVFFSGLSWMDWLDLGGKIITFVIGVISFGFLVRTHRRKMELLRIQKEIMKSQKAQEDIKEAILMDENKKRQNGHDKA